MGLSPNGLDLVNRWQGHANSLLFGGGIKRGRLPDFDWRSQIPEEIAGHKSLETIKDVGSLAKGFVHAQSMIGADKVVIPPASATPDEWTDFYAKTGRPEEPAGYELGDVDIDEDTGNWFKDLAHSAGLRPDQAQKLMNGYLERAG